MTTSEPLLVRCPSCNSDVKVDDPSGDSHCLVCGTHFSLRGHLCPRCFTFHQSEGALCLECGNPLTKVCRNCHAVNWSGSEICYRCDNPIDFVAMVVDGSASTTANRLRRQMDEAQAIKTAEELASGKRMAELLAIEEARQAELRQRMARQQSQERKLLIVVFSGVALFFILLVIYVLVTSLG